MDKLVFLLIIVATVIIAVNFFEKKSFAARHQLPYQETYQFMGKTMSYKVLGKGQPVILLHGSMTSVPWNGFEAKLAREFKVYVPNMPGFGASDAIDNQRHNTDLFSLALGEFIKQQNLVEAPIISLSLGTVVSAKTAAAGQTDATLIFVGAPSQVAGLKAKLLQALPLSLKRILVSTYWGKDKLLIPALDDNLGNKTKKNNSKFISELETSDVQAIADVNYFLEINQEFPKVIRQIKNKIVYIYGANDAQKNEVSYLTDKIVEIKDSGHNVFEGQPEKLIEIIKQAINE